MKITTLFIAALGVSLSAPVWADHEVHLPPMPEVNSASPLYHLPGMQTAKASIPAPSALPIEVITDLSNAPNPFDSRKSGLSGQTQISYQLTSDAMVSLTLYDLLGHKVRGWTFAKGNTGAHQGSNSFYWDGTNEAGQKVSKGGYIAEVVVQTPATTVTAIRKIGLIH